MREEVKSGGAMGERMKVTVKKDLIHFLFLFPQSIFFHGAWYPSFVPFYVALGHIFPSTVLLFLSLFIHTQIPLTRYKLTFSILGFSYDTETKPASVSHKSRGSFVVVGALVSTGPPKH